MISLLCFIFFDPFHRFRPGLILFRIFHLVPHEPVITDLTAACQRMVTVELRVHQGCCLVINVAHNRQHFQIALFSGEGIQGTLGEVVIKTVLMLRLIKMKIPRIRLILRMCFQPGGILMHHLRNPRHAALLIRINHQAHGFQKREGHHLL